MYNLKASVSILKKTTKGSTIELKGFNISLFFVACMHSMVVNK